MHVVVVLVVLVGSTASAERLCGTARIVENGRWYPGLKKLDGAIVENPAQTSNEYQVYVYENNFPHHTIKYISVDNVARGTCGASAQITRGGVGTSDLLILIRALPNREIRSVVDVWGTKNEEPSPKDLLKARLTTDEVFRRNRSYYLFKDVRALNRNRPAKT